MNNAPNFLNPSSFSDIQRSLSFFKKRYDQFYHHTLPDRFFHIIGDAILVILIIFIGSYASFSYIQQRFFSPTSAVFSIILPGEIITVGTQAKFLIRYENKTKAPLHDARITFQFHPFFESTTSSEFTLHPETHVLELGTIEANQEKEFVLSGIPFGALNETQTLSADLNFKSNAKEGREHIPSFARYTILKGMVHILCTAPAQVTYYQVFDHRCILSNPSENPVEHIFREFVLPSSYTKRSTLDNSETSLSAKGKKDISLLGFFQKEGVGTQKISLRAYLVRENKKYLQDETQVPIRVLVPALSLNLRHDTLLALLPGKTYPFRLHWKNESSQPISDVVMRISTKGDFLNNKNISSKDGIAENEKNTLTWTKGQISQFKNILPSQEGDISFTLTLDKTSNNKNIKTDHAFQIIFEPSASYTDQKKEMIKIFSIPLQLDISSDISLQTFARYYTADGEQIGRGPLPPRIGKTTRYQIFFAPKNSIHAIENFTVTAQLGPHTTWTGIVPIGSDALRYYPEKKTLTYLLSALPSIFSGSDEQFGTVFELALAPTPEDSGTTPILLKNIRATGRDRVTHMPLEFNAPDITTNLIFDSRAKSVGEVVR